MADLLRVLREVGEAAEHDMRKLILDVNADLVLKTPVDTGWAKANWVPSVGVPHETPAGSRGAVDQGARQRGILEIATGFKNGQIAYDTNNVPYINALADGHSSQAPAGWVEEIINRRVDEFNAGDV